MSQPRTNSPDEIIAQLVALDEQQQNGAEVAPADSTVQNVRAELETFISDIRQPVPHDEYSAESACERVTHMVQSLGREPSDPNDKTIGVPTESAATPADVGSTSISLGSYELLAKIGEGGMGAVYKARHTKLDKIVAIKVLPTDKLKDKSSIARFEREMRAVGKLDHPNIVRAMDAGEENGTHFLVMEYVPGVDLSLLVKQLGPLPIAEACELIRQAAVGLDEAHDHGMVHRDIKPSNLMLCAAGKRQPPVVKILDMGLALLSEAHSPDVGGLTGTGQVMGTLDYMAPEQGGDSKSVDIRADIYALGASLYKLLTGEAVYHGEQYQTLMQKVTALASKPAPPIRERRADISSELAALVHRLLEKNPAQRFATPDEVARALAPFAAGANLAALLSKVGLQGVETKLADAASSHTAPSASAPALGTVARPQVDPASRAASPTRIDQTRSDRDVPNDGTILLSLAKPARRPSIPKRRIALALASVMLTLLAAVVYRIQTDQGTLVVKIDDPTVQAILEQDGLVIHDKNSDRTWTIKASETKPLPSGEYQLKAGQNLQLLVTDDSGAELTTDTFTLKRKDEVRVRVTLEPATSVAAKGTTKSAKIQATTDPDRRAAEWVLSIGGKGRIRVAEQDHEFQATKDLPAERFQVVHLSISNPHVTDAELAHLKGLTNLSNLFLNNTQVSDAGLAHLTGLTNLTYLGLKNTQVTDAGLGHLKGLTKLSYLGLDATRVSDAGLQHLKGLTNLTYLDMLHTQVSDAGLAHLTGLTNLSNLFLNNTQVSDAGLAHLTGLTNLTHLGLKNAQVTDAGLLAHLKGLTKLTYLGLSATRVSDAGLQHLKGLTNLRNLNLASTKVTATGVTSLQKALPDCKITWDGGVIEPTMSPDRRAAEWVLSIGGTIRIKENSQERRFGSADEMPKGPFQLTGVELNLNPKVSDTLLANLQDCMNLTVLDLNYTNVSDVGLAYFQDCKNFTVLQLAGTQVSDAELARFQDCKNLTHLDLNSTKVSDEGLAHFQNCPNLTNLGLSQTSVSNAGLAHLKACKNLTAIDLNGTKVSDEGLAALFKDCPNLTVLALNSTKVSDLGLAHFKACKNLWVLELAGIPVSDAGLTSLADCPKLASLNVKMTKVTEVGVKMLSAALPKCKIEWDGGVIEPTVSPDRRAAEWVLSIGGAGTIRVAKKDQVFRAAKDLPAEPFQVVGINLIGNQQVTSAGLEHFKGLTNLTYLDLKNTQVSDAGLEHLKGLTNLNFLHLGGTQVSGAGLAHLKDLANFGQLNLADTQVSDAGLEHLKELTNLTALSLADTPVSDAVLEHLKGLTKLTSLNLSVTQVSDAGLVHLNRLTNLGLLWLDGTRVTNAGLEHLKGLTKLGELRLTGTKVTAPGIASLQKALPDCKITWDDPDRRAAEWVLSIGGIMKIEDNGQEREIKVVGELPQGAFELYYVGLDGSSKTSDAGLASFKGCKNLTELYLPGTPVSDAGLVHFQDCKNLEGLNLSGTQVSDVGLAYFKDCKGLKILGLNRTRVSDAGLVHFQGCKKLGFLDLNETQVGDAGLAHFKESKELQILYLNHTQVSDAGLAHFKNCNDLRTVTLQQTKVSDAGLAHFKDCKNLGDLGLNETQVSDAVLEQLANHPGFSQLIVTKTKATEAGVKKLSAALPKCRIEWDGGVIEPSDANNAK